MVIYTDRVPQPFAGFAIGPLILIRPQFREDAGLLAHEQTHVRQFLRCPFTHDLRYTLSRTYRQACEVEAYREQLKHAPAALGKFAAFLATRYDLRITTEQARSLLEEPNGN